MGRIPYILAALLLVALVTTGVVVFTGDGGDESVEPVSVMDEGTAAGPRRRADVSTMIGHPITKSTIAAKNTQSGSPMRFISR